MSQDVLIPINGRRAEIREPKLATFSCAAAVRVYSSTPEYACLQLRVVGPTTDNGAGKARGMIASVNMDVDELRAIRAAIDGEITRLTVPLS